jgi:hypothetical protein
VLGHRAQPLQRNRARRTRAHARRILGTVARADPECAIPGIPWWGDRVTFTTVPPPAGPSASSNAVSAMFSMPSTFSRHTARQPFAAISSAGLKNWPPALFTNTSRPPRRSSTVSTSRRACSRSRTSPATQSASPASSPISSAARSSTSPRRPAIVTLAPQRASSSAVALPRPVPPPVISATRPRSSPGANTSDCSRASFTASDHRRPHRPPDGRAAPAPDASTARRRRAPSAVRLRTPLGLACVP